MGERKDLAAEVRPFEWPVLPGLTEGKPVAPCHDCLPWTFEVFIPEEGDARYSLGEVWVRESHAVGCSIWDDIDEQQQGGG